MILHVLNGDCALDGWLQNGFEGEVLVWRENYLQGIIPQTADVEEFNRIRAGELHRLAADRSAESIYAELESMHRKLLSLQTEDTLVLWLDCCPFDQALKKRLLELIESMPEAPAVYLVQQDVVWNQAAFKQYSNWQSYPYTSR